MAKRKKQSEPKRGMEALGIMLIGLGIMLALAILSFHRTDNPALNIAENAIKVKNWLGPVGAAVAAPMMNFTLGYPVLFVPLLIILGGITLMRKQPLSRMLRPSIMIALWALVLSVALAMPDAIKGAGVIKEYFPSGLIGGAIAARLELYLGTFGSVFTLLIIVAALTVLTLRLSVADLVVGLEQWWAKSNKAISAAWNDWKRQRAMAKKKAEIEKKKSRAEKERLKRLEAAQKKEEEQKRVPANPEILTPSIPEKTEPQPEVEEKIAEPIDLQDEEEPPAVIKTTLNDLLQSSESSAIDTAVIRNAATEQDKESQPEETQSFEVKEEVKVEEVDYDQLVRESVSRYEYPSIDLLVSKPAEETSVTREELQANADLLESKLLDFGIKAKVIRVTAGPVITMYELAPAPGVKVSQIVSLANDLALAMEAKGLRMVAPIPGKAAIGIEIPNRKKQIVYLKPLIKSEDFAQSNFILPLALGKAINGKVYVADLAKMPHLLIAGSTGSGKSVGINTIIASLLYSRDPGAIKFVMVDPKRIELSIYRDLREHFLIWRTDLDEEVITKPQNAVTMLNSMVMEMELRYDKLAKLGVRGIEDYNERVSEGGPRVKKEKLQHLPYIVVIIDELADLMMIAAKEVETPIARLAQMARAVGIHLILATQRPSVDVITGVIKANFPARIAYMVTTRPDSKTILDSNGAEQLLGNGDMLFLPANEPRPIRLQNPLITTREVESIIKHIRKQPKLPHYSLPQPSETRGSGMAGNGGGGDDELYEDAKRIVVQHQQGSISLLQRRLKIGYSRAARLIDIMEEDGIVGPPEGSKPRQVYYLPEEL